MKKCWRAALAAVLLAGTGCCHNCGCCNSCCWDERPPPGVNPGYQPYPAQPRAPQTIPPVGPQPGVGAYGGT